MQFDPFLPPLGFFVFFIAVWCTVAFIISRFGWHQLARAYAAESKPAGTAFRNVNGSTNLLGSYNRCLNTIAADTGLYVETQILFRAFHQPLFFPWSCVSAVEPKTAFFGLWTYTKVTIDAGDYQLRLQLPSRALTELQRHLPGPALTSPHTHAI